MLVYYKNIFNYFFGKPTAYIIQSKQPVAIRSQLQILRNIIINGKQLRCVSVACMRRSETARFAITVLILGGCYYL